MPPRIDSDIEEFDETARVDDSGFGKQIQFHLEFTVRTPHIQIVNMILANIILTC